jgi:hypothetical protein
MEGNGRYSLHREEVLLLPYSRVKNKGEFCGNWRKAIFPAFIINILLRRNKIVQ